MLKVKGKRTVREFHRAIGAICWDKVGMARTEEGLKQAVNEIRRLRDEFWQDVNVPGEANNLNPGLDYAGRVADYMEFAEVLALDALERRESCGGHFREEYPDAGRRGAAKRRRVHLRRGVGIQGRRDAAGAAQGAVGVRRSSPDAAELQVTAEVLGLES